MNQKAMMKQIRKLGLSVSKTDGEFRVNYRGGSEETAYFTNDCQDALATAIAMNLRQVETLKATLGVNANGNA